MIHILPSHHQLITLLIVINWTLQWWLTTDQVNDSRSISCALFHLQEIIVCGCDRFAVAQLLADACTTMYLTINFVTN